MSLEKARQDSEINYNVDGAALAALESRKIMNGLELLEQYIAQTAEPLMQANKKAVDDDKSANNAWKCVAGVLGVFIVLLVVYCSLAVKTTAVAPFIHDASGSSEACGAVEPINVLEKIGMVVDISLPSKESVKKEPDSTATLFDESYDGSTWLDVLITFLERHFGQTETNIATGNSEIKGAEQPTWWTRAVAYLKELGPETETAGNLVSTPCSTLEENKSDTNGAGEIERAQASTEPSSSKEITADSAALKEQALGTTDPDSAKQLAPNNAVPPTKSSAAPDTDPAAKA
ncbi:DUF4129 domain-containing protein [Caenorhabditis elegans]|uniref:DUF4129 domain-containing protein n=1 Tax=Caenorhabditis elegans TaxID=6239 RepID=O61754_CAEEL|nr:DUF4129 domain-containing protein [Caenorhabditis elegans]CCD69809.2 DUF4129 domain-containing protein [Caenorhabditis elegans]